MDPVKIETILHPPCELFDPQGNTLGIIINELTLNDIRIQIKNREAEGYYIIYNNIRIDIDKKGSLNHWPKGFYDQLDSQLIILFDWPAS